jgi:hypothetical protein
VSLVCCVRGWQGARGRLARGRNYQGAASVHRAVDTVLDELDAFAAGRRDVATHGVRGVVGGAAYAGKLLDRDTGVQTTELVVLMHVDKVLILNSLVQPNAQGLLSFRAHGHAVVKEADTLCLLVKAAGTGCMLIHGTLYLVFKQCALILYAV